MAQWSRALVLREDLGSTPRTAVTPAPGDSGDPMFSSGF